MHWVNPSFCFALNYFLISEKFQWLSLFEITLIMHCKLLSMCAYRWCLFYCLYCSTLNFLPRASSKIISNYFQLFKMKVVTAKCKIWKRKLLKTNLIQFQLFIFDMPTCLQQSIHGRVLSNRVFSADEHHALIVSLRGWTLLRHMINLNQLESEKI